MKDSFVCTYQYRTTVHLYLYLYLHLHVQYNAVDVTVAPSRKKQVFLTSSTLPLPARFVAVGSVSWLCSSFSFNSVFTVSYSLAVAPLED